jgi:outer membrane protein assembly factor BamB
MAVEAATGRERWRRSIPVGRSASTPAVVDGILYVNGNTFHACRASDGETVWTASTPPGSTFGVFCPAVADGVVYGGGATLVALEARSGGRLWEHSFRMEDAQARWNKRQQLGGMSAPALSGEVLYVGSDNGCLSALERATGRELWRYFLGVPIKSSPIISGNTLFVGAWDGNLYAFSASVDGA